MPGVKQSALATSVPSTVVTTSGNSGPLSVPYGASQVAVIPAVTAYTSGTLTYEVQWSNDGVNFWSADPKDTFANISAVTPGVIKVVTAKAAYYRVTWTSGSFTHTLQHAPATTSEWGYTPSPMGYEQGAGALGPAQVGYIPSTALSATFAQATPTTYTAIVPVPSAQGVQAGRMSIKVNATAYTGSPILEVLWSFTGLPYNASSNPTPLMHADPIDQFATLTSATDTIKELVVKAPYFALAATSGTVTGITFSVDAGPTAL